MQIITDYQSPNFDNRPANCKIASIIIHFTEMDNVEVARKKLCDSQSMVSAHYLIAKNGDILRLVAEHRRAWHAGRSFWRGKQKLNDFSIGIELDNNGKEHFSYSLMHSLINLCHDIKARLPIRNDLILGHSDIAPDRKVDPGRLFDWAMLYRNGIGIYCDDNIGDDKLLSMFSLQQMFKDFGYNINVTGIFDQTTKYVVRAFCDHFYQENRDYNIDTKLCSILKELLAKAIKTT